jgi:hypothetical protein
MIKNHSDRPTVHLLWTGGWDSTFQLLLLLLIHRQEVIPIYLIDAERRSTGMEIRTMKRIKDLILSEYPNTSELFKPTRFYSMADIAPDMEISDAFQAVLDKNFLGSQYEWLPRFCKEKKISDLQLCIHLDDKAHFVIEQLVSEKTDEQQSFFYVDRKYKNLPEYTIFSYFSFPLFNLSKKGMAGIAHKQKWERIMDMTWFCHNPTRKLKPCGVCNPCLYTIEEGLGYRISIGRRTFSFFYRHILKPMKKIIVSVLR